MDSWLNEPFFKEYIAYKQLTSENLSSFLFFPAQHETFSYPMHICYSLLMAYATTISMENQQQKSKYRKLEAILQLLVLLCQAFQYY